MTVLLPTPSPGRKNPRARKRARLRAARARKLGAGLQEWHAQTHERAFRRAHPHGILVRAVWDAHAEVWRLATPRAVMGADAVVVITSDDPPRLLVATVPFDVAQPRKLEHACELRNVRRASTYHARHSPAHMCPRQWLAAEVGMECSESEA